MAKSVKKSKESPAQKSAPQTLRERRAAKALQAARKKASRSILRETRALKRAEKHSKGEKDSRKTHIKKFGRAPQSSRVSSTRGPTQALASRTKFYPKVNDTRVWLVVDAKGQTVGRVATEIAMLLRGKHKATFTPNNDMGDFVIVINSKDVLFSRNKETTKEYYQHSGWISGLKTTTPAQLRKVHPERIIENAVRRMVPRSPLGRLQMRKLKIYPGAEHPHSAQNPVHWKLRYNNSHPIITSETT